MSSSDLLHSEEKECLKRGAHAAAKGIADALKIYLEQYSATESRLLAITTLERLADLLRGADVIKEFDDALS